MNRELLWKPFYKLFKDYFLSPILSLGSFFFTFMSLLLLCFPADFCLQRKRNKNPYCSEGYVVCPHVSYFYHLISFNYNLLYNKICHLHTPFIFIMIKEYCRDSIYTIILASLVFTIFSSLMMMILRNIL